MDAYTLYDYWYVLYRKRVTIYLIVLARSSSPQDSAGCSGSTSRGQSSSFLETGLDDLLLGKLFRAGGALAADARGEGEQQKVYLGMLESSDLRERVHAKFPQKSLQEIKRDVDFESGGRFPPWRSTFGTRIRRWPPTSPTCMCVVR
ncbi:MAG: hypothetical protein U0361_06470 [Nitrospiraceae bacterium]